jgi:heme-degrading monooxygenase HmoA
LRRYNNNKSDRKGHLQGMSTISTMSTIQPRKGHEHEYFQRAKTVNVSRATREQVRGMPKDVPWSQGLGKAYLLSDKVDGSSRSVVISTWKNSESFLYPEFTNKSSGPPMNITGNLGRLTPYVSQD